MNGERQSLNIKQISHLACPSLILHLWTSVALTKKSDWTLAQSVSNKWTQPKLKKKEIWKISLLAISFSSFLTESWILPFLLHIYLLKLWAKEKKKDWSEHCAIRFNSFPFPFPLSKRFGIFFSTLLNLLWKMSTFVRKPK